MYKNVNFYAVFIINTLNIDPLLFTPSFSVSKF
ncbi:TPA: hypothetical protein QCU53_002315 [Bacillus thuringiensis]|nr:hypothetical protein [Bacillus thuringiensis]